jgi:hypothetical protein
MEPAQKTDAINDIISNLTGKDRVETIRGNLCMVCGGDASNFRDAISQKEYTISGLCQSCQDDTFGGPDDYYDDYEDDGQPSEYDEWQDLYGGDDWDQGQYDGESW